MPIPIGAIIAAGGSILGGILGSKGASDAAAAQLAGVNAATQAQLEMYYQSREDVEPWRRAGVWALGTPSVRAGEPIPGTVAPGTTTTTTPSPGAPAQTSDGWVSFRNPVTIGQGDFGRDVNAIRWNPSQNLLLTNQGTIDSRRYNNMLQNIVQSGNQGPEAINSLNQLSEPGGATTEPMIATEDMPGTGLIGMIERGPGEFEASPSYEFVRDEALRASERAMSATGRLGSGAAIRGAEELGANLASTEYDNFLRRYYDSLKPYQSLAGVGQTSAGQQANLAANAGNALANLNLYRGEVGAGRAVDTANAWTGAANSLSEYFAAQAGSRNNIPTQQYNYPPWMYNPGPSGGPSGVY